MTYLLVVIILIANGHLTLCGHNSVYINEKINANDQELNDYLRSEIAKDDAKNGPGCFKIVAVQGHGIDDYFKEKCEPSQWFGYGGASILGDPSVHDFCIYHKTEGQLIVIRRKKCTFYKYVIDDEGKTTRTEERISSKDCQDVIQEMMKAHRENTIKPGKHKVDDKRLVVITEKRNQADGSCEQEMEAVGRGVLQFFNEKCFNREVQDITTDILLIYGDCADFSFCLFSITWDTLVVIRNGECTKNLYTKDSGKTTGRPVSPPMTDGECEVLKRRITTTFEQRRISWLLWLKDVVEPKLLAGSNMNPWSQTSAVDIPIETSSPQNDGIPARLFRYLRNTKWGKKLTEAIKWW